MLARDTLRPPGHQLGVVLGSLELCAVGKENERQAAGAQGLRLEQRRQRIAVEVDPAMRHFVPGQEIPSGLGARGAAPADDCGPDAVHPPLSVELPCQPAAEQRPCGRRAGGCWKHGRAKVVRASRLPAASRPSTTADARSQPCTAPRSRATSTPIPRARSRAPTTRRKRRVPPESRQGPSSRGPQVPAPEATRRRWRSFRPPSRRQVPGPINRSYEIRCRPHDRSDTARMAQPDRRRRSRSGRVLDGGDLGRGPRRRIRRGARRCDRRGRGRSRRPDRRRALRAGRGDHQH